jgi:hypothetical protein
VRRSGFLATFILNTFLTCNISLASMAATPEQADGWWFPSIGKGNGDWSLSMGTFPSKDGIHVRNLQLRGDIDLMPGVRYHTVIRSDREMEKIDGFDPHFDENYIEGYGFKEMSEGALSASLRVGTIRSLHFPYPDSIAMFDQVPGISDLRGGARTGYSGELLTLDYAHKSGLGAHATGINWDFGRDGSTDIIEDYIYYRVDLRNLHFETHVGGLQARPEPLGRRKTGYNYYLGTKGKRYDLGILYEKLDNYSAYTGIMVQFPINHTTKWMGKVAFDYDRNPEGFAMQIPLAYGTIGDIQREAPENGELVGEIQAKRIRTYWQNGQVRNFYEHRLSNWGETDKQDLVVVIEEEPWYLQAEALVSPHTSFSNWDDLKTWEENRQGPAQLSQKVVYKYYRVKLMSSNKQEQVAVAHD